MGSPTTTDEQHDSPHSSQEIGSHHATPATKLSTFSPEESREVTDTGGRSMARAKIPPAFDLTLGNVSVKSARQQATIPSFSHHDPFISASSVSSTAIQCSTDTVNLSPVVSALTPPSLLEFPCSVGVSGRSLLSLPVIKNDYRAAPHGKSILSAAVNGSPPRSSSNGASGEDPKAKSSPSAFLPSSWASCPGLQPHSEDLGPFSSEDGTSRSLMIQVGPGTTLEEIEAYFNQETFPSLSHIVLSDLTHHGTVYVSFKDIRDADKAISNVQQREAGWTIQHIGSHQIAMQHQPQSLQHAAVPINEAQVLVSASYLGMPQQFDVANIGCSIKEVLQRYGDVMAFCVDFAEAYKVNVRAEYYNIESVSIALANVEGVKVAMCTLSISRYEPACNFMRQTPAESNGPIIIDQEDSGLDMALKEMTVSDFREAIGSDTAHRSSPSNTTPVARSFTYRKEVGGQHTPTPLNNLLQGYSAPVSLYSPSWSPASNPYTGYGYPSPLWSPYSPGAIGQERGSPALPHDRQPNYQQHPKSHGRLGVRQYPDFASGHHNVVDIDRIRRGEDVRTTIMLRNIPNKIDQAMLKDIIDETSLGKYDFMYLRIDFANNCNVGYAFINFDDPIWIVDFVKARAGHRWNRYNSDKVAEVSYATIQGRDCLVQKFRNSSVMLEHPSFRPKLFHTTGPLLGAEDKFPGPDNPSKMRRSVENAEHVGLFAPRAGQTFRDEQRRRRSQYDRGTRLAEIEDSYEVRHYDPRSQPRAFRSPRPFGMFNDPYSTGYSQTYF